MVIYQTPHLIVSGPNLTNQAKLHSSLITRFFSTESSKVMDIDSCSLVFSVLFSETHFTRMIWDFNSYACNLYHRLVEQNSILETHQPRETCFMLCDQQTEFIKSKWDDVLFCILTWNRVWQIIRVIKWQIKPILLISFPAKNKPD